MIKVGDKVRYTFKKLEGLNVLPQIYREIIFVVNRVSPDESYVNEYEVSAIEEKHREAGYGFLTFFEGEIRKVETKSHLPRWW